ncbi:alcohol acetyltransferase [Penicillium nucicola]|uniref:alcohol acetyltransferase n=1 Tax=Penicillium nucicola TaxID=1850975 RepID=UPI0025459EB2|nr:alcohol acetyltransferase [Penicillium nucicola]KAJ5748440.1 alcohol acetyltransferase [Penicillium nucicola]
MLKFLRFASPNERRTISRENLGFYHALTIAAIYEYKNGNIDLSSTSTFFPPLKHCIEEHPYLSVVVKDSHTEKPVYEGVPTINLDEHVSIIHNAIHSDPNSTEETETIQKTLASALDRPWPNEIPPWQIIVLPLSSAHDSTTKRCFIAFSFSHTLGDGMVGTAFHRTFLEAWRQPENPHDNTSIVAMNPSNQTIPEPFDTPARLPISWKYLLGPLVAVYLPKFLAEFLGFRAGASTVDAGTWTGSRTFEPVPAPGLNSRVRILEIEASLVQKALVASRVHDSKLTATLHQFIVRALSKAILSTDVTNFVSGTPVDMRSSIGVPALTWGLYVSGYYEVHPRLTSSGSDIRESGLSDEMWLAASSMTKKLAECGTRLQDQAIGLLRYAPSIRGWMLGKIGLQRDSSYELSNLLAFDGGVGDDCKISKMVFSQPGNCLSAPLVFNVISVKGGSLVCTISWQVGALDVSAEEEMPLVDGICSSIRADFEALRD